MQAITTKYIPCTDRRPSRVKATCDAGSVVVAWDHSMNVDENHHAAAVALQTKLGWQPITFAAAPRAPRTPR